MVKSFALGMSIMAMAFGLFVGCSDTSITGSTDQQTTSSDPYEYLKVDPAEFTDFSEIPTADQVFTEEFFAVVHHDSSDTNHGRPPFGDPRGGRHGRGPGDNGHGRDFGGLKRGSYQRIIAQLGLSDEQKASIRLCFEAKRSCDSTSASEYRAARKTAMNAMHDAMAEIRAQAEAGTITKEQARAAIAELQQSYRAEVQGLLTTLNAALAACRASFEECVEAILTADQLAIWERLTA
jgi:hypothetical protein